MPNLRKSFVSEYWRKTEPRLARILSVMENVEHWAMDDIPDVSDALSSLGKKMDGTSTEQMQNLAEKMVGVMAYVACGKALRIVNWMDETHPGLVVKYVVEAKKRQNWAPALLLMDRLQTIRSLQLMGKVFAPSRSRLIIQLLKEGNEIGGKK